MTDPELERPFPAKQGPEQLSPEAAALIGSGIVKSLVEQVDVIEDPISRLLVLNWLSKGQLASSVNESMIEAAAQFRYGGGTWREIGEALGVTPPAAHQRLTATGRARTAAARRQWRTQNPRTRST